MAGFSEDQLVEYQEIFGIFDNRGDSKVQVSQIGEVLRACGQNPTESEWKKYVGDNPAAHNSDIIATVLEKRLTFNEFLPMLQDAAKSRDKTQMTDFVEGFKVFDKEQNGMISAAELRHVLTNLGEKMTEEECELLFQGHEDAQGNINYEELIDHVVHGKTGY